MTHPLNPEADRPEPLTFRHHLPCINCGADHGPHVDCEEYREFVKRFQSVVLIRGAGATWIPTEPSTTVDRSWRGRIKRAYLVLCGREGL